MDRVFKGIIKHKKSLTLLFLAVAVVCAIVQGFVTVNYNMLDYLPSNAQSTKALEIMNSEFSGDMPDARVMIKDVTIQEALDYKRRLSEIDGVTGVSWLDDVVDVREPLEMAEQATVEGYYKDGNALISFSIRNGGEIAVTKAIYEVIGDDNALAGTAVDRAVVQELSGTQTRNAMLIAVPLIIIILILSTGSWIEPLLYLGAIGISVIINMGTNLFLGDVSFLTNSVSPILQLAVSLDYAIFLLRSFESYRKETGDVTEAMFKAMKRALSSVAASAATTLFGFMALMFMKFGIGADLGTSLLKGIVFSFLSVMVFLPALTLFCYKLIDKTKHKKILPEFKKIGGLTAKIKIPVLIIIALIIIPGFMAQSRNIFTYGSSSMNPTGRSGLDGKAIEDAFGHDTAIVLLVPKGQPPVELELCQEISEMSGVKRVLSYVTLAGTAVPPEYLSASITSQFYSENYARIIAYVDTPSEGVEAFALVEKIQQSAAGRYGDTVYSCGQSVNMHDMKNVITHDNLVVNIIAVSAIFLVLLVTFRSLSLPILLVATIETAIWTNLAIPYFTGSALCYVGYLIINTVQLGATVDYAILLTDHYLANRKTIAKAAAVKKTLSETFGSILISAATLTLAGATLWLTSSNPIVSEMGMLLARGTLFSMTLVVCFLPAALTFFDKFISRTTLNAGFYKNS